MEQFVLNNNTPQKKKNPKRQLNKKKLIILIVVSLLAIITILMSVLYTKNSKFRNFFDIYIFRKEVSENNLNTIYLNEEDVNYSYAFNKNIAVLNGNNLDIYNSSAKKQKTLNVEISNPIFNSNDKHLIIAEKNGQKVYSISDNNVLWQTSIEGDITNIVVNKNGYVAIIANNTGYKTAIIVFDPNGNQLFLKRLATKYAIDVSISADNKYLAIAEANFSGTIIKSNIEVLSIDRTSKEEYNYEIENNKMIVNIEYQNKNKLVCMFDDSIQIIDNNKISELMKYDYSNILFIDINLNSAIAQVEKGSLNQTSKIKFTNTSNNTTNEYEIDGIPKSICSCYDITSINLGIEAIFVKTNGWLVKKYKANQEIQNIIANNHIAGIVYKNKIEIIKL